MIISHADQRNAAYVCFSERIGQYKLYKGRWKIAISIFGRAVKVCLITPEKCRERALPIDPRMILIKLFWSCCAHLDNTDYVRVDVKEQFPYSDALLKVTLSFQKNVDNALFQERYQTVSVVVGKSGQYRLCED